MSKPTTTTTEEIRKGLADELQDPEARRDYADEFLSSYIFAALQN